MKKRLLEIIKNGIEWNYTVLEVKNLDELYDNIAHNVTTDLELLENLKAHQQIKYYIGGDDIIKIEDSSYKIFPLMAYTAYLSEIYLKDEYEVFNSNELLTNIKKLKNQDLKYKIQVMCRNAKIINNI